MRPRFWGDPSKVIPEAMRSLLSVARRVRGLPGERRARGLLSAIQPDRSTLRVGYLSQQFPHHPSRASVEVRGGAVKLQYLAHELPHDLARMNCLYAVSSIGVPHTATILDAAAAKGVRIVWNQNGVYYPAWCPEGWKRRNVELGALRDRADYVVYQSAFCQSSAERFLGPTRASSVVLHNPVDTDRFVPCPKPDLQELTFLTLDTPFWRYRVDAAIHTLALVAKYVPRVRLLIPGGNTLADPQLAQDARALCVRLGVADRVEFGASYSQRLAPAVMNRAHILLHPQYNDACPNLVVEALACGLPVVYSATGGVPELVGEAGTGVPGPVDFDAVHPPDPVDLAAAVMRVADRWPVYAELARAQASQFSVKGWVSEHRAIFESLIGHPRAAA